MYIITHIFTNCNNFNKYFSIFMKIESKKTPFFRRFSATPS